MGHARFPALILLQLWISVRILVAHFSRPRSGFRDLPVQQFLEAHGGGGGRGSLRAEARPLRPPHCPLLACLRPAMLAAAQAAEPFASDPSLAEPFARDASRLGFLFIFLYSVMLGLCVVVSTMQCEYKRVQL